MTDPEITALAEELEARHCDTWPLQIGLGDLTNADGPRAATALRALLAEREVMRGALEMIAGQTPRDQTSKADPGREHYLRTVLISIARQALSALAKQEIKTDD